MLRLTQSATVQKGTALSPELTIKFKWTTDPEYWKSDEPSKIDSAYINNQLILTNIMPVDIYHNVPITLEVGPCNQNPRMKQVNLQISAGELNYNCRAFFIMLNKLFTGYLLLKMSDTAIIKDKEILFHMAMVLNEKQVLDNLKIIENNYFKLIDEIPFQLFDKLCVNPMDENTFLMSLFNHDDGQIIKKLFMDIYIDVFKGEHPDALRQLIDEIFETIVKLVLKNNESQIPHQNTVLIYSDSAVNNNKTQNTPEQYKIDTIVIMLQPLFLEFFLDNEITFSDKKSNSIFSLDISDYSEKLSTIIDKHLNKMVENMSIELIDILCNTFRDEKLFLSHLLDHDAGESISHITSDILKEACPEIWSEKMNFIANKLIEAIQCKKDLSSDKDYQKSLI